MKAVVFLSNCLILNLQGVVISSGDGSGNTSAPVDDPGFANVGRRGAASAVYVGNQWVLTAQHVGVGSVVFGGMSFSVDPGSDVILKNPTGSGLTVLTDLRMYRLTSDPGLPSVDLVMSSPTVAQEITMIGNGMDRAVDQTFWDVTPVVSGPDVWTVTTGPVADVTGWETPGSKSIRWGDNRVSSLDTVNLGPFGDVISLITTFDQVGGTAHEAQGANGDSGGAVFWKEGGTWKLGGIINAVGTSATFPYDGRPPGETGSDPYPYFGRVTTAADLSEYRDQILAVRATPEPSSCLLLLLSGTFLLGRRRS